MDIQRKINDHPLTAILSIIAIISGIYGTILYGIIEGKNATIYSKNSKIDELIID